MKRLDLRRHARKIATHVAQRVRDYPRYVNEGPGRDEDSVSQITLGYQFDQAGWLALVFDTRPGASPDGAWSLWIDPNAIELDEWRKAFHDLDENGSPIEVTLPDGSAKTIGPARGEKERRVPRRDAAGRPHPRA